MKRFNNNPMKERVRMALNAVGAMPYISGPNGPVSDRRVIMPDGSVRRDVIALAKEYGLVPLYRQHLSTSVFDGVESEGKG